MKCPYREVSMEMDCPICCDVIDKSSNIISCHFCSYKTCLECAKQYLLQTIETAHCMSCRRGWTREFMLDHFPKKFVLKEYKEHRENVLFDKEKSLLPASQPYAERELRVRAKRNEVTKVMEEKKRAYDAFCEDHRGYSFVATALEKITEEMENIMPHTYKRYYLTPINFLQHHQRDRICDYPCHGNLNNGTCTVCCAKTCEQCGHKYFPRPSRMNIEQHVCREEHIVQETKRREFLATYRQLMSSDDAWEYVRLKPVVDNFLRRYDREISKKRREMRLMPDGLGVTIPSIEKEKRTFVRPCPVNDCRGFLSTAWKCGICENFTCSHCHEVKGKSRDSPHVCLQENVETAKLLAKDTRPCPNCGTRIFKISGCFAENTPILMLSGDTKMSQDIAVGDVLVGDDGNPRVVEELVQGEDAMYSVMQNDGMDYIVNSKHTLVLKYIGDGNISGLRYGKLHEDNSLEITVDEYLSLPQHTKDALKGYKYGEQIDVCTNIHVRYVGRGKYYGWKVDGNHRFLGADMTVLRNCDQMWCTECHTGFSWSTGEIERGNIHNPHYYEFMRRNQGRGGQPREIRDIPCGGLPDYTNLYQVFSKLLPSDEYVVLEPFHRVIGEVMDLRAWYRRRNLEDKREIRVKYLLKDYDDVQFKRMLQMKAKAQDKITSIDQVLDMFVMASTSILQRVREISTKEDAHDILTELEELRKYMNASMEKISAVYDCKTPSIDPDIQLRKVGERKQW